MKKRSFFTARLALSALIILSVSILSACSRYGELIPVFSETDLAAQAAVRVSGEADYFEARDWNGRGGVFLTVNFAGKGVFVVIDFGKEVSFNSVVIKEKGSSVAEFEISALNSATGEYERLYASSGIGDDRICNVGETTSAKLWVTILKTDGKAKIDKISVYDAGGASEGFRVVEHVKFSDNNIADIRDDAAKAAAFSLHYAAVTDVVITDAYGFFHGQVSPGTRNQNAIAEETYYGAREKVNAGQYAANKARFKENLDALRVLIDNPDIRIWCSVGIEQLDYGGALSSIATSEFIFRARNDRNDKLKVFFEENELYGLVFSWNAVPPGHFYEWRAYNQLIDDAAQYANVSVSLSIPNFKVYGSAKQNVEMYILDVAYIFNKKGESRAYENAVQTLHRASAGNVFDAKKIVLNIPAYGKTATGDVSPYSDTVTGDADAGFFGLLGKLSDNYGDFYFNGFASVRDNTLLAIKAGIMGVGLSNVFDDAPYEYAYSLGGAIAEVI
ncbi:MAG: hypothetical protein LBQ40_07330 [Clostridiales bacterium]|nr:hypothetical protein [Clostridiales bacterium]